MFLSLLPALFRRSCRVGVESAQSPTPPAREEIGATYGLTHSLAFILLQPIREIEECTEQGCPVIVQQFDEAGFLDETAQLDEMARPLTALPCPIASVGTGASGIQPTPLRC
jgi:hypothetical protein